MKIETLIPSLVSEKFPNVVAIISNLFYAQGITGQYSLVSVAWTLCIEIQFYLFFLFVLLAGKNLEKNARGKIFFDATFLLIFISGLASVIAKHFIKNQEWKGNWFYEYWYYFSLGSLSYYAINNNYKWRILKIYIFALVISMFFSPTSEIEVIRGSTSPAILVGLVTALILYFAGVEKKLSQWGDVPFWQYLGRISYSLYLVHLPVLVIIMRGGYKLTHTNQLAAVFWFVMSGLASVGTAHIFFNFVEKPSMRLASRLKPKETTFASSSELSSAVTLNN